MLTSTICPQVVACNKLTEKTPSREGLVMNVLFVVKRAKPA
jgi:hypothetical protein